MMKTLSRASLALAGLFLFQGCATGGSPRVIRLQWQDTRSAWHVAVNRHDYGGNVSSRKLLRTLTDLKGHHGDVLLLDCPAASQTLESVRTEISEYCQSNSIAVYLLHNYAGIDIFAVRAYHWCAPYDNPMDIPHAAFFYEGTNLGSAEDGFNAMLAQIAGGCPKQIFILGSMYDVNRGFPPDPTPYEKEQERLDAVLRNCKTDLVRIQAFPGF